MVRVAAPTRLPIVFSGARLTRPRGEDARADMRGFLLLKRAFDAAAFRNENVFGEACSRASR